MLLTLKRDVFTSKTTTGQLFVNGAFECFVLEDVVRPKGAAKVFGQTAIPDGVYEVVIVPSPRFKKDLPRLLNVPGFQGILIHPGNYAEDTDGCLLPGKTRMTDRVLDSILAFNALFTKLTGAVNRGEKITISIENHRP